MTKFTDRNPWVLQLRGIIDFDTAAPIELAHRMMSELVDSLMGRGLDTEDIEMELSLAHRGGEFGALPPRPVGTVQFPPLLLHEVKAVVSHIASFLERRPVGNFQRWSVIAANPAFETNAPITTTFINESAIYLRVAQQLEGDSLSETQNLSDLLHYHLFTQTTWDPNLKLANVFETLEAPDFFDEENLPTLIDTDIQDTSAVFGERISQHEIVEGGFLEELLRQLEHAGSGDQDTIDLMHRSHRTLLRFISEVSTAHSAKVGTATVEESDFTNETDIATLVKLDDHVIADTSMDELSAAFGPVGCPHLHDAHLNHLPRTNRTAALLTMATRHAELHLLGAPFEHECTAWKAIVLDIAERLKIYAPDMPKWANLIR